jgi:hypothetical protein
MACVFNAMLKIRVAKEKSEIEPMSKAVLVASPIPTSDNATRKNPIDKGMRLSNRDTSHPEIGRLINELIGINKRIVPNSASLNPKEVFIVGIRDAQEEKQNPDRRKKILRAIRCRFLRSIKSNAISVVLNDFEKMLCRDYQIYMNGSVSFKKQNVKRNPSVALAVLREYIPVGYEKD